MCSAFGGRVLTVQLPTRAITVRREARGGNAHHAGQKPGGRTKQDPASVGPVDVRQAQGELPGQMRLERAVRGHRTEARHVGRSDRGHRTVELGVEAGPLDRRACFVEHRPGMAGHLRRGGDRHHRAGGRRAEPRRAARERESRRQAAGQLPSEVDEQGGTDSAKHREGGERRQHVAGLPEKPASVIARNMATTSAPKPPSASTAPGRAGHGNRERPASARRIAAKEVSSSASDAWR